MQRELEVSPRVLPMAERLFAASPVEARVYIRADNVYLTSEAARALADQIVNAADVVDELSEVIREWRGDEA